MLLSLGEDTTSSSGILVFSNSSSKPCANSLAYWFKPNGSFDFLISFSLSIESTLCAGANNGTANVNAAGNIDYLRKYEAIHGFEIMEIQKHEIADIAVSSTKVRQAIIAGKVGTANALLKHPYTLKGEVIYGKQLGTTIGFPTANIKVDSPHKIIPPQGIYAVFTKVKNKMYRGMLYIGDRPTVNGIGQSIEVNIFDFNENIYGAAIEVIFVEWIRGDKKLASLEELIAHLNKDKEATLQILDGLDQKIVEI